MGLDSKLNCYSITGGRRTYLAVDRNIAQQVASRLNDGHIKSVKVRVLED